MQKEEFLKNIKTKKTKLVIGIMSLIIACMTMIIFYTINNKQLEKVNTLFNEKNNDTLVKLDVQLMLNYFASSDTEGDIKAYIAFDKKSIPYIVVLNSDLQKTLQPIIDYTYSDGGDKLINPITVYGKTAYINDELKDLVITTYNKFLNDEVVNEDNFEDYFGAYYLDTTNVTNNLLGYGILTSIIFLIIAIIFICLYTKDYQKRKKQINMNEEKIKKITKEIDKKGTYHNHKTNIYLTNNYLVNYKKKLDIILLSDIVWIYDKNNDIYIFDSYANMHIIKETKNKEIFVQDYDALLNKLPDVLNGYSPKNLKKAQSLYKK